MFADEVTVQNFYVIYCVFILCHKGIVSVTQKRNHWVSALILGERLSHHRALPTFENEASVSKVSVISVNLI